MIEAHDVDDGGWGDLSDNAPPKQIVDPETCQVLETNDQILSLAQRLTYETESIKATLDLIRAELWKRSGGADGPKTRTIAGSTLKAKLVAAEPRWNGLREIAAQYPENKLLVPSISYRVSLREWAAALKTTSDDPAFNEMVAAIRAARQPDGLPSLKVEE